MFAGSYGRSGGLGGPSYALPYAPAALSPEALKAVADASVSDYLAKNPEPQPAPKAVADLATMSEAQRKAWVDWFCKRPDVANFLAVRSALTDATSELLHRNTEDLIAGFRRDAYSGWRTKSFKPINEALTTIIVDFNKALQGWKDVIWSNKEQYFLWSNPSKPFDEASIHPPGKWNDFYFNVEDMPSDVFEKNPGKCVSIESITLPEIADLEAKTIPGLSYMPPSSWKEIENYPLIKQFQDWVCGGFGFNAGNSTNSRKSSVLFISVADYYIKNVAPRFKAFQFAQLLKYGTIYSSAWAFQQAKLYQDELNNGAQKLPPVQSAFDQAVTKAKAASEKLGAPESLVRQVAEHLADQPTLALIAKAKGDAADLLAKASKQDTDSIAVLLQLSEYGVSVQKGVATFADGFLQALTAIVLQATNFGTAINKVAGDEADKGIESAQSGAADIKTLAALIAVSGVTNLPEGTTLLTLQQELEAAKKKAEEAKKKQQDQKAWWEAIKINAQKVGTGQTTVPIATKCVPHQVPADGGITIQVVGIGFESNATVTVAGVDVPTTVVSDYQLSFVAPPGPAGKAAITITNPGKTTDLGYGQTVTTKVESCTVTDALEYLPPEVQPSNNGLIVAAAAAVAAKVLFF